MRHCASCKKEYEVSAYAGYCSYPCKKQAKGKRIPGMPIPANEWEAKYNKLKEEAEKKLELMNNELIKASKIIAKANVPLHNEPLPPGFRYSTPEELITHPWIEVRSVHDLPESEFEIDMSPPDLSGTELA